MNMNKIKTLGLIGVLSVALLIACGDNDDEIMQPTTSTLTLNISGLEDLGSGYLYEGWIIVDGSPVTTGTFSINESGALSQTEFELDSDDLDMASTFVLTIEPSPDPDPSPSAVHILAGDFGNGSATLSIGHGAALGDDFSGAMGNYILATPTDGAMNNENSGIWFLDISMGSPMAGLDLPTLPDGWKYEGWAVIDGIPVTTGTFTEVDMMDDAAPFSGEMDGPSFPGEDFLMNATMDLMFPTDLAGGVAVISIEPDPDNSSDPFLLKPLVGMIPGDATDHVTYMMDLNEASFPSGTATR
jgi:hypothetical protein